MLCNGAAVEFLRILNAFKNNDIECADLPVINSFARGRCRESRDGQGYDDILAIFDREGIKI